MYTPGHFTMAPQRVEALLQAATTAQLVTAHPSGPVATLLPFTHRPDPGGAGLGSLIFHVTRVNPVWREPYLGEALAIISGPDGYIDADWYASNAQAPGVPTWNYVTVHGYGPLVIHDDPAWVRAAVGELSARHGYDDTRVDADAHTKMLRAIVGIELPLTRVEAKDKLNQNRTPDDVAGAIRGLRGVGEDALADQMQDVSVPHAAARSALIADVRQRRGRA